MVRPLDSLIEKPVIVYTSLVDYRGILKEVTEEAVVLRGATGWHQIPMDRIKDIRPG
ncbi:hypothetical protein [Geoalkalibacter halelectricus]|uniref:Uncharacterized protein n=1 Tax=Geoalkalibacter halelectricus TaxID=2847045 RepID=A0ABY5ZFE7_9BACT|nr:hypothetical protein [Geoalkalibacter halelectricus]MDO3377926.1 hypothetical protein [Geoalkalibacter halelectricus]UWZ77893.1 hypothetical protein L9S41_09270 [Geoalkalibacter halelectricus]